MPGNVLGVMPGYMHGNVAPGLHLAATGGLTALLVSSAIIAAITLLCRITLKEKYVEDKVDALPYLVRKPITCGVCRTFWITFVFQFLFVRFQENVFLPGLRQGSFGGVIAGLTGFFVSWMVTGMAAVFIFYLFLTFYEGSHYLAHKAEEMHN